MSQNADTASYARKTLTLIMMGSVPRWRGSYVSRTLSACVLLHFTTPLYDSSSVCTGRLPLALLPLDSSIRKVGVALYMYYVNPSFSQMWPPRSQISLHFWNTGASSFLITHSVKLWGFAPSFLESLICAIRPWYSTSKNYSLKRFIPSLRAYNIDRCADSVDRNVTNKQTDKFTNSAFHRPPRRTQSESAETSK